MPENTDPIREWISSDGGLYCLSPYVGWEMARSYAVLDGDFTAAELRAIADYMDKHGTPTAA